MVFTVPPNEFVEAFDDWVVVEERIEIVFGAVLVDAGSAIDTGIIKCRMSYKLQDTININKAIRKFELCIICKF